MRQLAFPQVRDPRMDIERMSLQPRAERSAAMRWTVAATIQAEQNAQVVGVYLSYTETDMTVALDIHKNSAFNAASTIVNAVAAGDSEVLVDDDNRRAKTSYPARRKGCSTYSLITGHDMDLRGLSEAKRMVIGVVGTPPATARYLAATAASTQATELDFCSED